MSDIEHQTHLVLGSSLSIRATYLLSPKESKELQCQVLELLERGYIYESMSPCIVPAILMPKKDGSLCLCVDSRAISRITVKYKFSISYLDDMLDQVSSSKVFFFKIDLKSRYHYIRICPKDEWKAVFNKQHGLYEWMIMPFELSNTPSMFIRFMHQVLCLTCLWGFFLLYTSMTSSYIVRHGRHI